MTSYNPNVEKPTNRRRIFLVRRLKRRIEIVGEVTSLGTCIFFPPVPLPSKNRRGAATHA